MSGKLLGLLNDASRFGKNPMDTVADDTIICWCDLDPKTRYPVAAAVVRLFKRPNDKAPPASPEGSQSRGRIQGNRRSPASHELERIASDRA
jgi:hypothetical protein